MRALFILKINIYVSLYKSTNYSFSYKEDKLKLIINNMINKKIQDQLKTRKT